VRSEGLTEEDTILVRINDMVRMTWLRIFLRVLSVGYLAAFIPWITLILLNAPILAPGGRLAPLLRFQPYNAALESMMAAIHIVWAVMLWRASDDPAKHSLFIDFTIWANAGHGLVMRHSHTYAEGPRHDGHRRPAAVRDSRSTVVAATEASA
jgi:hypothetical protein